MGIFADRDETDNLADEFEAACLDPDGLDCGFEEQRKERGYANFGFDADEAEELRLEEEERIAREEAEDWDEDYYDDDDEDDYFDDDEDDEDFIDWDDDEEE